MGRIKITKAQMARLVELKTTNLLEIAVKKTQLDKVGPVRGGNSDNAIWPTTKDSGDPSVPGPVTGTANPGGKRGTPTKRRAIDPNILTAPPQTSTPEAWRVDAGGCLQCSSPNPNCPFPTEQDCQNSLSSNNGQTQQSYKIDAGGCLPCPSTATSAQCPYTDPNCTVMVNEGRLYEDEYDDEYGSIDDFEDDLDDDDMVDYTPDSETPIDRLAESIRKRLNEESSDGEGWACCCEWSRGFAYESPKCIGGWGCKCGGHGPVAGKISGNIIPDGSHEIQKDGNIVVIWPNKPPQGKNQDGTDKNYGTRDERQGRRLDEQWSGIVGEPCCPVHAKPNTAGWFAMNHYDNQGNPCVGGCGDHKEPMGIDHMEESHRKDHEGNRIENRKNYKGQRNNHDDNSGGMVHYKPHPNWCCEWDVITGCFAKGDEVEMSDGTMKAIDLIEIGDEVKTGRDGGTGIVSETLVHPVNDITQVVNINGITAEPYHPVLVDNKWIPIKELGNMSNKFIDNWYNLRIDSGNELIGVDLNAHYIIGDLIVSGLGNDCQRLLKDSDKRENQLVNEVR